MSSENVYFELQQAQAEIPASTLITPVLAANDGVHNTSPLVFLGITVGTPAAGTAGYAVGCILITIGTAAMYINTGSITAATWTSITIP